MDSATQALMHVINSLRITRTRHVQRIKGLDDKERQMDSDSQFLIGSASGAMEERERLRSKMERLKHESEGWKAMQLREASALNEQLAELDDEHERLEGNLNKLSELMKRTEFQRLRGGRKEDETRERRYGFLRQQGEGWQAEFARVTEITGVSFDEGRRDAVEKVVAIYREKEARNKSLYKYVTEEAVQELETVDANVARLQAEATQREAEAAVREESAAKESLLATEADKYEETEAAMLKNEGTVDAVLPLWEKLGGQLQVVLPRHMEGKALSLVTLSEYLTAVEEALDSKISDAHGIVRARAPPPPPEEEEGSLRKTPEPIIDSDTLVLVKMFIKPRELSTYDPAAKLHKKGGVEADMIEMA